MAEILSIQTLLLVLYAIIYLFAIRFGLWWKDYREAGIYWGWFIGLAMNFVVYWVLSEYKVIVG